MTITKTLTIKLTGNEIYMFSLILDRLHDDYLTSDAMQIGLGSDEMQIFLDSLHRSVRNDVKGLILDKK